MMAEFRFDFAVKDKNLEPENTSENANDKLEHIFGTNLVVEKVASSQKEDSVVKAQELIVDLPAVEDKINPDDIDVISVGNVKINYINSTGIEAEVKIEHLEHHDEDNKTDHFVTAVSNHYDLISGVYEGGLKVWECCLDLANYLAHESTLWSKLDVLELGCGAGIPGVYLMVKGAVVHFQDYNTEVLERLTVPNVIMNQQVKKKDDEKKLGHTCRYFAGDWSDMTSVLMTNGIQNKYDVILTSETIYNVNYYDRLHTLLQASLKPSGCVYVAAKTHYFGVGGGTRIFEDFVNKNGIFNIKSCWQNKDGLQREILKLEFNRSIES
ncbi:histidine protein methyltransferase 1 homolog [Anneissia japonica]|uniref:histidine protein methyltransferase 1 homolog n=1 Tax=Anneissia japonica TaxID=1529436 RepID=UPI0014257A64|nr:histidine protein methyltransferase 1 homolog [Anneissia japonica]